MTSRNLLTTFALALTALALTAAPTLATGDASQPGVPCPNENLEGFSETLPECRAYEMVTPPYKAGDSAGVTAVSTDGSSVLTPNIGTYAGRENASTLGTPYLASRTTGWASVALDPPSTEFPAQQYWGATADLSRTLWRLRSPSEPVTGEDLYLREADGTFVKIGPLSPPEDQTGPPAGADVHFYDATTLEYRDASSDLSHVLFDIKKSGPLWPFDSTVPSPSQHGSLYEYSGLETPQVPREPSLVGVSDGGTALNGLISKSTGGDEPVREVLPAGRLISDCSTSLGSEEEDGYNAMSADGNTVFFTAVGSEGIGSSECRGEIEGAHENGFSDVYAPVVSELYARVGDEQTVPISEPTAVACTECRTGTARGPEHPAVPERPAEFQGASEDGSKAFFITEQELLPGANGMNLYEYDFDAPAGHHVSLISSSANANVLGVARVSEDGSHVYFVAEGVLANNANRYGRVAISSQPNLYVFIRDQAHPLGEIVFVTPLSRGDQIRDWGPKDDQRRMQATPDGRYLVFQSYANVASSAPVSEGVGEVFEYDSEPVQPGEPGELAQVSAPEAGFAQGAFNAEGIEPEIRSQQYVTNTDALGPTRAGSGLAVSADGSTVVFESKAALTEATERETGVGVLASSKETNAYVFHSTGALSGGGLSLLTARTQRVEGLDASGDDVFVKTAVPLVASDGDDAGDIYDVRVDGGVPLVPVRTPCVSEEACLGASPPGPVLPSALQSQVASGGNVAGAPAAGASSMPAAKPRPKALTTAEKLEVALGACRKDRSRARRVSCERAARRRYASKGRANARPGKSERRTGR